MVSDSEFQILQRVAFWIEIFTTHKFLEIKLYNGSDFDFKKSQRNIFWTENIEKCHSLN